MLRSQVCKAVGRPPTAEQLLMLSRIVAGFVLTWFEVQSVNGPSFVAAGPTKASFVSHLPSPIWSRVLFLYGHTLNIQAIEIDLGLRSQIF